MLSFGFSIIKSRSNIFGHVFESLQNPVVMNQKMAHIVCFYNVKSRDCKNVVLPGQIQTILWNADTEIIVGCNLQKGAREKGEIFIINFQTS